MFSRWWEDGESGARCFLNEGRAFVLESKMGSKVIIVVRPAFIHVTNSLFA